MQLLPTHAFSNRADFQRRILPDPPRETQFSRRILFSPPLYFSRTSISSVKYDFLIYKQRKNEI